MGMGDTEFWIWDLRAAVMKALLPGLYDGVGSGFPTRHALSSLVPGEPRCMGKAQGPTHGGGTNPSPSERKTG